MVVSPPNLAVSNHLISEEPPWYVIRAPGGVGGSGS